MAKIDRTYLLNGPLVKSISMCYISHIFFKFDTKRYTFFLATRLLSSEPEFGVVKVESCDVYAICAIENK